MQVRRLRLIFVGVLASLPLSASAVFTAISSCTVDKVSWELDGHQRLQPCLHLWGLQLHHNRGVEKELDSTFCRNIQRRLIWHSGSESAFTQHIRHDRPHCL
jgi:hypothetical protein